MRQKIKNEFKGYLKEKGIRYSKQREDILDIFLVTEKHINVIELYELVRRAHPHIGYATVYRAMNLILAAGLAEEVNFGDGSRRYEHKHEHHDHLICVQCGQLIEIQSSHIEQLQAELTNKHGFMQLKHTFQIYGICKSCQADKTEPTRQKRDKVVRK
jgi:Fur family ferric uptake transcriptional regulator